MTYRRLRWLGALGLLLVATGPAAAFHTVFDFTVDRVTVDGNVYGPFDDTPDFVDEFNDLTHWFQPYGTSSVSNGRLHVKSPGRHFPGPDGVSLDLSNVATSWPYLNANGGNFIATAVFDPIIPPEGHFYHFTLISFGSAQYFNELFGIDIHTVGGVTRIEQHLVVLNLSAGEYRTVETQGVDVTAAQITGQLHFRLSFDGPTQSITGSFSTDGGTTFEAPFASVPIFTEGRTSAQLIIGADPRSVEGGGTTTTLTSTTSTTTTTTVPPPAGVLGTRLSLTHNPANSVDSALLFRSSDRTIDIGGAAGSSDDPTIHGGTLRVSSPDGRTLNFLLPASGWRAQQGGGGVRGYLYKDTAGLFGPVTSAKIVAGRRLAVMAHGVLPFGLETTPAPVSVLLATGDRPHCATFGGVTRFVPKRFFKSRGAPRGVCAQ